MTERVRVRIAGVGSAAPERRLTNKELEKAVETSDEWIVQRTGIRERRIADEGVPTSHFAAEAGKKALENAGVKPEEVDLLYVATSTPDRYVPGSAPYVQAKIGCFNAGAGDVNAACSGFIYGFNAGWHAVASGQSKNCLLIGAETISKIVDFKDRSTCILFGDGAGATLLQPSDGESDVLYCRTGADGRLADLIEAPAGGSAMMPSHETLEKGLQFLRMRGREVYKIAVPKFVEIMREAIDACSLKLDDIKAIVPHQMNARMIEGMADRLGVPIERFYVNIDRYGNTSAASIPIALDEAVRGGRIKRGDLVLLVAMGAGLTWGTSILKY